MANIHTPERQAGESFASFKARRTQSRKEAGRIAGHGLGGGVASRKHQRDAMRTSGTMGKRTRAYVALMAAAAAKRVPNWQGARDGAGGAYTLTGRQYFPDGTQRRRMWLAGISAQRGF